MPRTSMMPTTEPGAMHAGTASLCVGNPRFSDAALDEIATRAGPAAAWVEAFARYGAKAPAMVQGDFAVGVRLATGAIFLAVDRFAVRSLCYRHDGGQLLFAARADELAATAEDLDPQALFEYLYFHVIPSPRTVFRGVWRLPPGHCAHFHGGTLSVEPFWQPRFEAARGRSLADLKAEFREILADAVRRRMDGNVGCFLSGGTDSSTVAGMVGQVTGAPARTFSIGFDAAGYDEMEYSRIAARHFGTEHHEYYVTPEDLIASVPEVAGSYDQPFGNSSVLPAYYCARMARDAGVTRMFGGDGGDELFGGNTRYAKERVFGLYEHVPSVLRKALLEPLLADNPVARRLPLVRKAASYVNQARVRMPDRTQTYNLVMWLGIRDVLANGFLAQVDPTLPVVDQRKVFEACTARALVDRMLAFDWRYTLAENDLPKVVGATRLAGLPVDFPLLDDRLVDFSTRLPPSYKVRGLRLRWFFKEALRGFLPDAIITKKKQGFGLPFGVWAARHPGLYRLADDSVRGLAGRGILREEFADTLMRKRLHEHPKYYGEMVWIAMMMEQWMRAHCPGYRFA